MLPEAIAARSRPTDTGPSTASACAWESGLRRRAAVGPGQQHRLHVGHLAHGVAYSLATNAALLDTAEWKLRRVEVGPLHESHAADAQLCGDAHETIEAAGCHAGLQAIPRGICHADRLLNVRNADHRRNGPEGFVGNQFGVRRNLIEDGRLE